MKNRLSFKISSIGSLRWLVALFAIMMMLGGTAQAQVSIPGT